MQRSGCAIMTCGLLSPFMNRPTDVVGQCPKYWLRAVKVEDVVHEI